MKSFPFYKQHDVMDCGPTCLRIACPAFFAGVAKHYGRTVNMEALGQQAQISKEGVSLLFIAKTTIQPYYLTHFRKLMGLRITKFCH